MTLPDTNISITTPRSKVIALGVLALVFLMGFAVGKFTTKPNISKQTSTVTTVDAKTQTQTNTQAATQTQTQQVANVDKALVKDTDVVTTTTEDKKTTGETVTTTTTETKTHVDNTVKSQDATKTNVAATTNTQVAATTDTQTKTVAKTSLTITQSQANWRLAAFAGFNSSGLKLSGSALTTGPLSYGGEVDRRIIGPFWLGVMGEKAGAGYEINGVVSFQF